ncbi:MAG: MarR family winged helix-turn-helix transcriptional regulator [Burkholderiales bacterium]|nr:MarR family winged helix-turn-helix transcriptional regulator [Burkholderiales bacterium]
MTKVKPNAAPPGVDFGRLPGYIGYQVRQTQSAIFRDIARSIGGLGVTPGEFSLLTMLEANPGLNSVTLARLYRLDKATLSLSLKRLAGRGLIRTERSAEDRRYYALRLTTAGRKTLARVTRHIEEQERAMDAVLGPGEREQILDALRRIAGVFDR